MENNPLKCYSYNPTLGAPPAQGLRFNTGLNWILNVLVESDTVGLQIKTVNCDFKAPNNEFFPTFLRLISEKILVF